MRCMNIRRSKVDICGINNLRRFDIVFCMIQESVYSLTIYADTLSYTKTTKTLLVHKYNR